MADYILAWREPKRYSLGSVLCERRPLRVPLNYIITYLLPPAYFMHRHVTLFVIYMPIFGKNNLM